MGGGAGGGVSLSWNSFPGLECSGECLALGFDWPGGEACLSVYVLWDRGLSHRKVMESVQRVSEDRSIITSVW